MSLSIIIGDFAIWSMGSGLRTAVDRVRCTSDTPSGPRPGKAKVPRLQPRNFAGRRFLPRLRKTISTGTQIDSASAQSLRGSQRRLMQFTGDFADVLWNGITGQTPPQFLNNAASRLLSDFKVGSAADAVELVQVIGDHSQIDQTFAQRGLGLGRVVDVLQQHGLIQDR